ncbi:hypothetical protein [Blastococcus sp. TF02A-26]|uniref:hypothetical protein n=1 Tax=Blastococcus sp. TF02A-26 TaxID=2250577 RepID=UPI000DEAB862|nr:hypothetical protein [Blastococcus sp. TF02A-26]RBY83317.1 hypothetical protein DQ240_16620 [Blastococcus sp. TF02A-26]
MTASTEIRAVLSRIGHSARVATFAERMREAPPRVQELLGRALVVVVVFSLTTPAEWLVPVARTALGRRGVSVGPPVTALLAVAAALEMANRPDRDPDPGPVRREPRSRSRWTRLRVDAETYVVAAVPAATALVPGLVLLPRRSPLWGWAVSAAGRLAVGLVLGLDNERRKRRERARTAGDRRTS